MQQISTTIEIAAPLEIVFAALTNVQDNATWIKSVVDVELIDDLPVAEGFKFRERGGFMGVNMTDEKRVNVYDPPRQFGFTGKFLGNSTHYELSTLENGKTEVKLTLTGTPPRGTPLVVQKRVLNQAVKRMTKDLLRLGARLEEEI